MALRAVVAGITVLAACDVDGIEGMYRIDRHSDSIAAAEPATCASEGPLVTPTYLWLDQDDTTLTWELCETSDRDSCRETNPLYDFYTFEGGWEAHAVRLTSSGLDCGEPVCPVHCSLAHTLGAVRTQSSDPLTIRLEIKFWEVFRNVPETECTVAAAYAMEADDECNRHVVIDATQL